MNSRKNKNNNPNDATVQILGRAHGLDVSFYEESFLRKVIDKRRVAAGIRTVDDYNVVLAENRSEAEKFCDSLRIIYSEFFRNPLSFALLEQLILPGLIKAKRAAGQGGIRIWSAGCASGQEPWSVAILLNELLRKGHELVPYRIFATDLSEPDLEKARAGVYSADELKNVRLRHLTDSFTRTGECWTLLPGIRERVQFSQYDLLDADTVCPPSSIYGGFDLVLCSNVLLYYNPEAQLRILDKLCAGLAGGGWLITGESERQIVERAGGFRNVFPSIPVFQQRKFIVNAAGKKR